MGKSVSSKHSKKVLVHDEDLSDVENDLIDDDDGDNDDDGEEESPYRDPPEGFVRLRPSQFKGIPSTVFIEYPPELGIKRTDVSVLEELGSRRLNYTSYWERLCIKNAFLRAGFIKTKDENSSYWTVMWSKHQNESQLKELNCLQKVNHFPSSWCIGRKDRLTRTINTMKRIHGPEYFNFHPDSYILPQEREIFIRTVKNELASAISDNLPTNQHPLWIIKPVASSCGKGIKVLSSQQVLALPSNKKALLQRYLMKPFLINKHKFDLRIYVLVTGVDPLRIYIHEEGLTRISTVKYSLNNISNRFAHLTNYSINKKASVFKTATMHKDDMRDEDVRGEDTDDVQSPCGDKSDPFSNTGDPETEGYKWSISAFKRWLANKTSPAVMTLTFQKIYDLCIKTIIAAEGEITPILHNNTKYRSNCYELFGMDVILDHKLEPTLLEVNISPSLMGSSPLDKRIKGTVVADLFHIVGIYPYDTSLLKKYNNTNISNTGVASASAGGMTSSEKFTTRDDSFAGNSNVNSNNNSSGKYNSTINSGINNPRSDDQYTTNSYTNSNTGNPFSFTSLSKMMNSQDAYRKQQCPQSIDITKLNNNDDSSWLLLLMIEDEFNRAKSSRFSLVHPVVDSCVHYTTLYRNGRFSDHLLAKWILTGGSKGLVNKQCIPRRYLHEPAASQQRQQQRPASGSRLRPSTSNARLNSTSAKLSPNKQNTTDVEGRNDERKMSSAGRTAVAMTNYNATITEVNNNSDFSPRVSPRSYVINTRFDHFNYNTTDNQYNNQHNNQYNSQHNSNNNSNSSNNNVTYGNKSPSNLRNNNNSTTPTKRNRHITHNSDINSSNDNAVSDSDGLEGFEGSNRDDEVINTGGGAGNTDFGEFVNDRRRRSRGDNKATNSDSKTYINSSAVGDSNKEDYLLFKLNESHKSTHIINSSNNNEANNDAQKHNKTMYDLTNFLAAKNNTVGYGVLTGSSGNNSNNNNNSDRNGTPRAHKLITSNNNNNTSDISTGNLTNSGKRPPRPASSGRLRPSSTSFNNTSPTANYTSRNNDSFMNSPNAQQLQLPTQNTAQNHTLNSNTSNDKIRLKSSDQLMHGAILTDLTKQQETQQLPRTPSNHFLTDAIDNNIHKNAGSSIKSNKSSSINIGGDRNNVRSVSPSVRSQNSNNNQIISSNNNNNSGSGKHNRTPSPNTTQSPYSAHPTRTIASQRINTPLTTLQKRIENMTIEINKVIDAASIGNNYNNSGGNHHTDNKQYTYLTPRDNVSNSSINNNSGNNNSSNQQNTHNMQSTSAQNSPIHKPPRVVHNTQHSKAVTTHEMMALGLTSEEIYKMKNNMLEVFYLNNGSNNKSQKELIANPQNFQSAANNMDSNNNTNNNGDFTTNNNNRNALEKINYHREITTTDMRSRQMAGIRAAAAETSTSQSAQKVSQKEPIVTGSQSARKYNSSSDNHYDNNSVSNFTVSSNNNNSGGAKDVNYGALYNSSNNKTISHSISNINNTNNTSGSGGSAKLPRVRKFANI